MILRLIKRAVVYLLLPFYRVFRDLRIVASNPSVKFGYRCRIMQCAFEGESSVGSDVSLNQVRLGRGSYLANGASVKYAKIGKFCSIGPGAMIGLSRHPMDMVSTSPAFYSTKQDACPISFYKVEDYVEQLDTDIGNDVWIGARAVIVGGVSIGDGAVIASSAVVTKDVPAYAVVGGVPARTISMRFSEEEVAALLKNPWWEWPDSQLKIRSQHFTKRQKFMKKYYF